MLGFLNLAKYGEEYKYSANIGILNIIDALKWIQENIESFGGDPNNVTLFGQSGGGSKITALMASPLAKGLFERGIVESGGNTTFMSEELSEWITDIIISYLEIEDVEQLQSIPYEDLLEAGEYALSTLGEEMGVINPVYGTYTLIWEPVVDGVVIESDLVTDDGLAESTKDYGLMVGAILTEFEADDLALDPGRYQSDNPNSWSSEETEKRLNAAFGEYSDEIVDEFLSIYPDKSAGDALFVDTGFRVGMEAVLDAKDQSSDIPVYAYIFSYESPIMNGVFTAYHTAELPFVFDNIELVDTIVPYTEDTLELEDKMSQAWINFARYGNPNVDGMAQWEPYRQMKGLL